MARTSLLTLVLVVALLAVLQQHRLASRHQQLRQYLEQTGVAERRPHTLSELRREPDPFEAGVLVGRAMLADVLESPRPALGDHDDQAAKLDMAVQLANEALEERPASWSALLVKGAATYLKRSLARDDRLITQHRDWEAPLEAAQRMAPHEPDPQRFLTMAYLEIWPMLSEGKREKARGMLGAALEEPKYFSLFLEPWLTGTVPPREALRALPDAPHVWQEARSILVRTEQWQLVTETHAKWLSANERTLRSNLAEARDRTARGDIRRGRSLFALTAASLRPDTRWEGLFGQVMQELPPGPVHRSVVSGFEDWLGWNLERCLFDSCRLNPTAVARLSGAVGGTAARRARYALAAQDLPTAERLEDTRGSGIDWSEYWLHKATFLLIRGDTSAAVAALLNVDLEEALDGTEQARRDQDLLLLSALRASAESGTGVRADPALGKTVWRPRDWLNLNLQVYRLVLQPAHSATALELTFATPPPRGAAIEIRWNGGAVGSFEIDPQRPRLYLAVDASPQLHILDLEWLGGRRALADVRLVNG